LVPLTDANNFYGFTVRAKKAEPFDALIARAAEPRA
jgi:hypothetical protein